MKQTRLSLAILSLLSPALVTADDLGECRKELTEQLVKNNPQAEEITFEEGTQRNRSRTEILYQGTGSFVRHTGRKETVDWQCAVDEGVVKEAHYRVTTNTVISSDMVSECERGIRERIRNENEGSENISFLTSRRSEGNAQRRLLEGAGRFETNGAETSFDYQCLFNVGGSLTDRKYEMR